VSQLDAAPLGTAEEERARAKAWMDTAAQHLRNEEHWRERAEKSERVLEVVRQAAELFAEQFKQP